MCTFQDTFVNVLQLRIEVKGEFQIQFICENQSKTKPKYKLRLRLTEFKITNANSHLFAPF